MGGTIGVDEQQADTAPEQQSCSSEPPSDGTEGLVLERACGAKQINQEGEPQGNDISPSRVLPCGLKINQVSGVGSSLGSVTGDAPPQRWPGQQCRPQTADAHPQIGE